MKQPALINTNGMSSAREMRRLKRERLIKEAGLQRIIPPAGRNEPHAESAELHFRDEDRTWPVVMGVCPGCGLKLRSGMIIRNEPGGKQFFSIKCSNDNCQFITPEFPSSDLAKRHWKLVANLSK